MRGTVQCGPTALTNVHGDFSIGGIPSGTYNLVIEKGSQKVTTLVVVEDDDKAVGNITLPAAVVNSVLVIQGGDTPDVLVGGLDAEAEDKSEGGDVEITLTVEKKDEGDASSGAAVVNAVASAGQSTGMLLDITIRRNGTAYEETAGLIEIVIPLPEELQGKRNYTVFRYHGETVDEITETENDDGEKLLVSADKTQLTLYAKKFSTYAVAYTEPSSGGPYFSITAEASAGGAISPLTALVAAGGDKTFTITADEGYVIRDVLVDGVSVGAVGSYTFSDVGDRHTIRAEFEAAEKWENPYADVNTDDWYYDAVRFVAENGLMNGTGDGTFSPSLGTTRGMIVTILHRMVGMPAAAAPSLFLDVDADAYYAAAVAWGAENGIVMGYSETQFGPEDPITREQLAAILYRYAQYKNCDVSVGEDTNILSYTDAFDISEYAIPALQWACGAGLMEGDDGKLDPQGAATRAQVAAILQRLAPLFE
jgi:hypothetical protein